MECTQKRVPDAPPPTLPPVMAPVLLMAVFAGSAAGAIAGKLPWGDLGEIAGQLIGGAVSGIAWAVWLHFGSRTVPELNGTDAVELCEATADVE